MDDQKIQLTDTERVWQAFSALLRQFIFNRVQNNEDAEDILQEIFLKIHQNIIQLNEEDKLRAWVYQIARNAIIDYYRRKKPISALPEEIEIPDHLMDEPVTAADYAPGLKIMIDRLPEKYRQALILDEFEDLPQKQIAQALGLSLPGAKSRIQRARKQLKDILLDGCHFEFDGLGNIVSYEPTENCPEDCLCE
jgi:RNA polymerase sigma-70 factor (ECF subfamily)